MLVTQIEAKVTFYRDRDLLHNKTDLLTALNSFLFLLLHNGNEKASIPIAHEINTKQNYKQITKILTCMYVCIYRYGISFIINDWKRRSLGRNYQGFWDTSATRRLLLLHSNTCKRTNKTQTTLK